MYSQSREDDKRWVIPSCDARVPQPAYVVNREPIYYWLVELASKDGVVQFYVKAKTRHDALERAKENLFRAEIPRLRKKFSLVS